VNEGVTQRRIVLLPAGITAPVLLREGHHMLRLCALPVG
jgi:hypothetical protein